MSQRSSDLEPYKRRGHAAKAAGIWGPLAGRAYPVEKIDGPRPGMSVYTGWERRST